MGNPWCCTAVDHPTSEWSGRGPRPRLARAWLEPITRQVSSHGPPLIHSLASMIVSEQEDND